MQLIRPLLILHIGFGHRLLQFFYVVLEVGDLLLRCFPESLEHFQSCVDFIVLNSHLFRVQLVRRQILEFGALYEHGCR